MTGKNYCTFYLVRHGQTDWNVKKMMQGHKDSRLTDLGIKQAQELAKKLNRIHFDAVFSSDLLRAKRTAEIIVAEKKLAIATTQLLRERSFGKYEGWSWERYYQQFEKSLEKYKKLTEKEYFVHKLDPSIESDEEVVSRLITLIREIAVGNAGKKILLVSHGGLMRVFLTHIGYGTRRELRAGCVKNTAYVKFLSDGVDFIIKEVSGIKKAQDIDAS